MHYLARLLLLGLLTACVATPAGAAPRLYVFDCGRITLTDVSAFGLSNTETAVRELFVPCYLIENEGRRLLWDAGLPLGLAGQGTQSGASGMGLHYTRSLLEQLEDLTLTPQDIDFLAFSHFHFDHVGAAEAFPTATLLISPQEWEAAFLHADENPIFDKSLYENLENSNKRLIDPRHDVFGDGSVEIVAAPGHTPGHQVLLLRLENTGTVVLSGDLYHFEFSRTHRRVPIFNTDPAQTLASMQKIETLIEAEGAQLWIEHNQALADKLEKAPAFYD